jgi:ABC-type branched-subunit amino acid transport system ATPase component
MESTTEILPTLVRIWERERTLNLGGGTDRHVAWCHQLIYRTAMTLTDEQRAQLNAELATYSDRIQNQN